jgi:alpha-mannosidase
MWEDLLLCQFHDTMSGSGIAMIHEDQRQKYRAIQIKGRHLLEEAYKSLYPGSTEVTASTKLSSAEHLVAINPTPGIARREVIPVCLKTTPGLKAACAQVDSKRNRGYIIAETPRADVPVANVTGLFGDSPPASVKEIQAGVFQLQNSSIDMTIKEGRITSIFDRLADRELLADGLTAGFVIYRDHPRSWDAWEVDISHLETRRALKFSQVNIVETGPVRASVACVIDDGDSKISVKVSSMTFFRFSY